VNPDQLFEQARSAIIKGDYLNAVSLLEQVLKADPNYPRASNMLGVAKDGAKNASLLAIDAGNKAEMSADFLTAKKQYELAAQLDPQSTSAADAQRRLKVKMQTEGEQAFQRGRLLYAQTGRENEAIPHLQRAVDLLPPDHPSVKQAQEWLAQLKR
jgi:tetratricopeptide (TPR) repeat protein